MAIVFERERRVSAVVGKEGSSALLAAFLDSENHPRLRRARIRAALIPVRRDVREQFGDSSWKLMVQGPAAFANNRRLFCSGEAPIPITEKFILFGYSLGDLGKAKDILPDIARSMRGVFNPQLLSDETGQREIVDFVHAMVYTGVIIKEEAVRRSAEDSSRMS